ncbi:MAG: CobW family GTP-binding protein [Erysipelotrichaceae bacterium]
MINVYIISGFLGAGKTTFIQKLLKEHKFDKVMLLENEFGEVGVDSAFFDSSLKMKEINNGCICCSLQGDFEKALEEIEEMGITDLLIEPSGVGKLSDIIDVVKKDSDFRIISHICIVDVKTANKYHNNFKEYFDDQVKAANALILSHLDVADEDKINSVKEMLKEVNPDVDILDAPVDEMNISDLLNVIVSGGEIMPEFEEHHHHDEDEECECCCGHHHEHEHHHHHHEDEECCCGHDHEEDECCHGHHHDEDGHEHHHHHHDADEDFVNIALRPDYVFDKEELENILSKMDEDVIRVKGYVKGKEGTLYLNYVLNEYHVFYGENKEQSLVVAIGSKLDEKKIREAFHD